MRYLIITLISLNSLTGLWAQDADITATAYQTVNVRSGPGTQFEIVGQLNVGDKVSVLGRESTASRWLAIPLPDGQQAGLGRYLYGHAEYRPGESGDCGGR